MPHGQHNYQQDKIKAQSHCLGLFHLRKGGTTIFPSLVLTDFETLWKSLARINE